jgi:hypothetical protein
LGSIIVVVVVVVVLVDVVVVDVVVVVCELNESGRMWHKNKWRKDRS